MSAQHIITDIGRKCDEDVAAAIQRNMRLVHGGTAMAQVAVMGAASALGVAGGGFLAVHDAAGGAPASSDEAADALWRILRPMVVRSIEKLRQSGAQS